MAFRVENGLDLTISTHIHNRFKYVSMDNWTRIWMLLLDIEGGRGEDRRGEEKRVAQQGFVCIDVNKTTKDA